MLLESGLNRSWNIPPRERAMAATRVTRMAQCGQHGAGSASGAELPGKVFDEQLRRILEPECDRIDIQDKSLEICTKGKI